MNTNLNKFRGKMLLTIASSRGYQRELKIKDVRRRLRSRQRNASQAETSM